MASWRLAAGVVLVAGGALPAQEKSWVGEIVLHTRPANEIRFVDRVGDKEVTYPFSGTWPFTVRDEKDGWLRLHDRRREGWVPKSDFVLARDAIPYFTKRIEADPRDYFALRMRGATWLQKKEPDKAIADFDACLAVKPADAGAHNDRGLAWRDKKEFAKAIADYTEAIRLDARSPVYFTNRGNARRQVKEYDRAIEDLTEAVRLEPRYAIAFYDRGLCYFFKKDYDQALKDYDESIRLDPKYAPAYRERGVTSRNKKEWAKALADYEQALKVDPKYTAAMADEAWLLATCADAKLRDGAKALGLAKKACESSGYKTPSHLSTLAAAYAEAGDFPEAARWMKKALESPEYAKTAGARGETRVKLYEAGKPWHEGP